MITTSVDPFASATAMLAALRNRTVSAVELLDLHLDRIARFNPALNAIVTPNTEGARAAAVAADQARAEGRSAPLLGLPLTIKDCLDVAGLRGTAGVPEFAERVPPADAPVVARVRAAGGVILGKTNVPPMAADWQANNRGFGRTNNPWDLTRTPGGSTGGGAAALAAGLTALEYGSDIGGSVRVPAAFCGVYGHRPSETALPRTGHWPGSPIPNPATVMGVQGPLARGAEDLELGFDVALGADVGEGTAWRLDLPAARHEHLDGFRVAVMPPIPWVPVDAEVAAALDHLAGRLSRAGATVQRTQPEGFGDLTEHHALYCTLLSTMTSLGEAEASRRQRAEGAAAGSGPFDAAMARGLVLSAADYIMAMGRREGYRAAYRAFFQDWDVLLTPVYGTPAFRHLDLPWPPDPAAPPATLEVNGGPTPYSSSSAILPLPP